MKFVHYPVVITYPFWVFSSRKYRGSEFFKRIKQSQNFKNSNGISLQNRGLDQSNYQNLFVCIPYIVVSLHFPGKSNSTNTLTKSPIFFFFSWKKRREKQREKQKGERNNQKQYWASPFWSLWAKLLIWLLPFDPFELNSIQLLYWFASNWG